MENSLSDSGLVPSQQGGGQSNTSYTRKTINPNEAVAIYEAAQKRLLDVNNWQEISGDLTASFTLTDDDGKPLHRSAQEGDNIRINIPGPGSQTGEGYDWVKIELIAENNNPDIAYTGMRVRPFPLPEKAGKEVAHFFKAYATSSFIVEKKGNQIKASVYGRNEIPNTAVVPFSDKVRNFFIGLGAILGLSKIQWKSLVKGLLNGKR
ncbi:hypothetical protein [Chitinophaga sp. MM2321]|uniref:hypothetical protein n=1 Tax=Chitinophaga sp. MM2321 TaxID=3137178 RepID=UPI0032D57993